MVCLEVKIFQWYYTKDSTACIAQIKGDYIKGDRIKHIEQSIFLWNVSTLMMILKKISRILIDIFHIHNEHLRGIIINIIKIDAPLSLVSILMCHSSPHPTTLSCVLKISIFSGHVIHLMLGVSIIDKI